MGSEYDRKMRNVYLTNATPVSISAVTLPTPPNTYYCYSKGKNALFLCKNAKLYMLANNSSLKMSLKIIFIY